MTVAEKLGIVMESLYDHFNGGNQKMTTENISEKTNEANSDTNNGRISKVNRRIKKTNKRK